MVAGVPLQRDLDLLPLLRLLERGDLPEEGLLRGIEVLDEVDDSAVVLVGRLGNRIAALVDEADLEALVQKGHDLHPLEDRLRSEFRLLEHAGIRPEGDRGARPRLAARPIRRSGAGRPDLLGDLAPLLELGLPVLSVPVHLQPEAGGERVHHRDPDAVEPAGDLVALAAELSARVQGGQDDFCRRLLGVFRVRPDRNSGPVVTDPDAAVSQRRDVDPGGPARHRLVDGIVDHLPDQVVQARRSGRSDVHARALPYGFEPFEDGDVVFGVRRTGSTGYLIHLYCHRRALSERSFRSAYRIPEW